ncbi:MAG TPA: M20/M25/M40 family metallo-hydrolase [Solirubrobacteraceae bacterium]|nr:M20/M25/M40 family metallo-hydrolase [Solirubrobacteraceae bacterium]
MIEGTAPTGRVILAAHYDSVPAGPGANDDGAGVSAILEIARALTAGGARTRNDVVLLLTDGEELGLLGAEAFVASDPLAKGRAVVLNHESRGAGGSATLNRVTTGDAGLIGSFAAAAAQPVADSASEDVAAQLPNGTDFTAFESGGLPVLDFAYVGRGAYYHSVLDDPAHVGLGSLQQMGDNTLALTRVLGASDLRTVRADHDDVYFNAPPRLLIRYPVIAALPLALLSLGVAIALVVLMRRRALVTVPKVLAGVLMSALLVALAGVAASLYWELLGAIRPGLHALATGTPYRPGSFQAAIVFLSLTVAVVWYLVLRRLIGTSAAATGVILTLASMSVGLAAALPATAHSLTLSALGAALGWLLALRIEDPASPWRIAALSAGLVPAAILLAAPAWIAFEVGLSASAYAAAPLIVLAAGLALPLIEPALRRRRTASLHVAAGLAAAVVATLVGLPLNPLDETQPVPTELTYSLDANTGKAVWGSRSPPDGWSRRYVSDRPSPHALPEAWGKRLYIGDARAARLPAPAITVLEDSRSRRSRTLRLRCRTRRRATAIGFYVRAGHVKVRAMTVAGRRVALEPYSEDGDTGFTFRALPASGAIEVELVVTPGAGPLRIRLADFGSADGLDELPGYRPPPRDKYLVLGETAVSKRFAL